MGNISGRHVYSEFRRQAERLRGQSAEIATEIGRYRARVSDLVEQRGQAVVDLTNEYLPDLSEAVIDASFVEVRDALRVIARRRDARAAELDDSIATETESITGLERSLDTLEQRLATEQGELGDLEVLVQEKLGEDPDFRELSTATAYAEERLARNEARIAEIRLEAKEKLPSYEKSSLFMYLIKRRFGTKDYKSRGFIRRMDRWVGRRIRFEEFKPSYDFLRVTPDIVQAELERRHAEFDTLMDKAEDIELRYADELGMTAAADRVEATEAERAALAEDLEQHQAVRATAEQELGKIQRYEGQFYAEAASRFRAFLSETRTSVLERHARRTPDRSDDRIVSSIERCNESLDDLEPKLKELAEDRAEIETRARDVESMAKRFRRDGYHHRDSYFEDDHDPRREIERYARGQSDEAAVWSRVERGHRRRRPFPVTGRRARLDPERSWGDAAGAVLSNPNTWVLAEAMVDAVGGVLGGAVRRGFGRRSRSGRSRSRGGRGRSGGGGKRHGFSIGDSF